MAQSTDVMTKTEKPTLKPNSRHLVSLTACLIGVFIQPFLLNFCPSATAAAADVAQDQEDLSKDGLIQKGTDCLKQGKSAEALDAFESCLKQSPDNPSIILLKATALSGLNRYHDAAICFRKCIQLYRAAEHDSAPAHSGLGAAYLALGQIDDAIPEFDIADSIEPSNGAIEVFLARAYLTKQNPYYAQVAIHHLDRAASLGFKAPYVSVLRGRALELTGKTAAAKKELVEALAAYPKNDQGQKEAGELRDLLTKLEPPKEPKFEPVSPDRRHYDLKATPLFVVVKTDNVKNLVTVGTASGHDADGGAQDGENDGYMTMPKRNFDSQTELKGTFYTLKKPSPQPFK